MPSNSFPISCQMNVILLWNQWLSYATLDLLSNKMDEEQNHVCVQQNEIYFPLAG